MSTRSLLVALAALLAVPAASAQTSFGLRAGLNVADLIGDDVPNTKPRLGLTGGVFANIPVGMTGFSVRPEVSYSQKGDDSDGGSTERNVDYVEVVLPLAYSGAITDTGLMLGGYAGPAIGFKVNENLTGVGGTVDTDAFKSTDIGAAAGITLGAGGFGVDGRYTFSLSDATNDSAFQGAKNGVFSVAATYSFGGSGRRY